MNKSIVFNGLHTLDFFEVRTNVARIPEVAKRIFEAQNIWDKEKPNVEFFFYNFLTSEDGIFLENIKLKRLLAAIVQVGLYDRYISKNSVPEYMVGPSNGDSALKVCTGQMTFHELVTQSEDFQAFKETPNIYLVKEPQLTGISLSEYEIWSLNKEENSAFPLYERMGDPSGNIDSLITNLIEECLVQQFINIGPGNLLLSRSNDLIALKDIQIIESIDVDPMLTWFWQGMTDQEPFQKAISH